MSNAFRQLCPGGCDRRHIRCDQTLVVPAVLHVLAVLLPDITDPGLTLVEDDLLIILIVELRGRKIAV